MSRYIDADKVVELLVEFSTLAIYEECLKQLLDAADYFKKRAPAADVEEVRHGKWVYHYRLKKFVCLECGFEQKHKPEWKYCPNCGAKMDGKENEK